MLVLCTLVHFKEKQQILILISTNHIICSLKPTSTIIDNEDKFVTLLLKQQEPLMGFKLTPDRLQFHRSTNCAMLPILILSTSYVGKNIYIKPCTCILFGICPHQKINTYARFSLKDQMQAQVSSKLFINGGKVCLPNLEWKISSFQSSDNHYYGYCKLQTFCESKFFMKFILK